MNVVLGQALRWRITPPARMEDVVRVLDAGERLLIALAAGYGDGFSTGWAPGSRLLLDLFAEAWAADRYPHRAFAQACAAFPARVAPLGAGDQELGGAAGSLLVADLGARDVEVTWIGEHRAVLVRGGEEIVVAPAHTLGAQLADRGPADAVAPYAGVLTRSIGAGMPGGIESRRAALHPGDTLALLGGGAAQLTGGLAGANAEAIVDRAMRERSPSNAVAVLAYLG